MGSGMSPFGRGFEGHAKRFSRKDSVATKFDDVAGHQGAKRDLREIVEYFRNPERFSSVGAKVPRGLLLVGPPGTGKTLLARAVAGESDVAFFSLSGSEFIEMLVGVGAQRVRELFREAKKAAPSIIFIDEVDAVGRSRGAGLGGGHDEREQTLNQLLAEMDGFARLDHVIVLAATNRPDVLDPALVRPGRFDRKITVEMPDRDAREQILKVHASNKQLAEGVDLAETARVTVGFSGADLEGLLNEAALFAVHDERMEISREDLSRALDKVVLGNPRETRLAKKESRRIAIHECGHAIVAHFSPELDPLHRVSILPRGMALGVTQQEPATDRHLYDSRELRVRLAQLLGGFAAEGLLLETTSTGAEDDLKKASDLALRMVAHWGMSETMGPVYYEYRTEHPFLGQRLAVEGGTSDATVHQLEREARGLVRAALERARACIKEHADAMNALVAALLQKETLEKAELVEILDRVEQQTNRKGSSSDEPDTFERPSSNGTNGNGSHPARGELDSLQ
jgi:cell division protease FtsH